MITGAAAGVLCVAGCTSGSNPEPSMTTASPSVVPPTASPSPSPSPSPPALPALPAVTVWQPSSNDIDPQVKTRAVRLIEALGNWPTGHGGSAAARARVTALGLDPTLVDQAGAVLNSAPDAALQVLEAQYGGILSDSASVLVVCRQWHRGADGQIVAGGTTVDVRLSQDEPRWKVTALHPAQPGPAVSPVPSAAQRVLTSPQLTLPPDVQADLRSGNIHASALDSLLTLTRTYRLELSVMRSGHPIDVFGTDRPSDHPKGRAFDVWRINGQAVVDPSSSRSMIEGFMRAAAAAGSYNVGGPWQLSGGAPDQFFSDNTHHDHVHVGFDT